MSSAREAVGSFVVFSEGCSCDPHTSLYLVQVLQGVHVSPNWVQTLLFSYSCRRYNCLTLNMVCSLVCLDCEITHLAAKVAVFLRKQTFLSLTHLGSDVLVQ